jgi:tRNA pseudouridine55 synthase
LTEKAAALPPSGVLLLDKPRGPTSHDVVAKVRRALGTRAVGHAGTLDPMATGLLVVLVGEGTKLSSHLSGADKRYRASILLGVGTDSLDADGQVTERANVTDALREEVLATASGLPGARVTAAIARERERKEQIPPAVSAIHVDGERAHALARRGEAPELPARSVEVLSLEATGAEPHPDGVVLEIELHVSKGYYVRALGRDLGLALGVPAHLIALRRLASGAFSVDEAVSLEPPGELRERMITVANAATRALASSELAPSGVEKARCGKRLLTADFEGAPSPGLSAWMHHGELIALGELAEGEGRVSRGFPPGK